MGKYLKQYVEASGANNEVNIQFANLMSRAPTLSRDPKQAAVQAKKFLFDEGFKYNGNNFTIQDVLGEKSGNCLGLPLLIGTILGEQGFRPSYKIIVNPIDAASELEESFFQRINEETPYKTPDLTTTNKDCQVYRCEPLEHLALWVGGELIEATSPNDYKLHRVESERLLSFQNALSCVCKDRAISAKDQSDYRKAIELSEKGLALWKDNREIYALMSEISDEMFDDKFFDKAVERYKEISGSDSLYYFTRFSHTQDGGHLGNALRKYPSFARAIAAKAKRADNPGEARFLFSIASQCYAESGYLEISQFYEMHANELAALFGKSKIVSTLEDLEQSRWGYFDYHRALFELTRNLNHLAEMEEAIETPKQQLEFLQCARATEYESLDDLVIMEEQFKESKLFKKAKI